MSEKRVEDPQELSALLAGLADADYCYLTTTGRVSGQPHEIEIWFGLRERTVYLLSGNRESSDWVKNLQAQPAVHVRIGKYTFQASGHIVSETNEDRAARELLDGKYEEWKPGQPFSEWAQTALPVVLDVESMA
jgi:deazaflavin-dependent oxidoreductase (nitroreductase family)